MHRPSVQISTAHTTLHPLIGPSSFQLFVALGMIPLIGSIWTARTKMCLNMGQKIFSFRRFVFGMLLGRLPGRRIHFGQPKPTAKLTFSQRILHILGSISVYY